MRVVSGIAKGIVLNAPKGMTTRPTTDKAKEGVFSAIQCDTQGARVLDVFAGSGSMGIEALSRGASSCVFVDADVNAIRCIKENLARTRLEGKVIRRDAISFLSSCDGEFDIIFSGPPYNKGFTQKIIPRVEKILAEGGLLLCETDDSEPRPEPTGNLLKRKEYTYGRVIITLFEKIKNEGNDTHENSSVSGQL